jgi:hypothetical protein
MDLAIASYPIFGSAGYRSCSLVLNCSSIGSRFPSKLIYFPPKCTYRDIRRDSRHKANARKSAGHVSPADPATKTEEELRFPTTSGAESCDSESSQEGSAAKITRRSKDANRRMTPCTFPPEARRKIFSAGRFLPISFLTISVLFQSHRQEERWLLYRIPIILYYDIIGVKIDAPTFQPQRHKE